MKIISKAHIIFIILGLSLLIGCKPNEKNKQKDSQTLEKSYTEEELYRPNFHFTPKANWMNDPNGMFYLNDTYHLYFQYYPDGNVWGPMHWGHAISKDLISWEELPIALYPDEKGYIFSGGAVVDVNNTSGFGRDGIAPVVAFFTYHNMDGEKEGSIDFQTQAIAYSLDEGMTWTKYEGNPIIPNPGIKDFRDPKVIWDHSTNKWIMSLAAGDNIIFYSSLNLKEWKFESQFGKDIGAHGGVWECPDLFPIKVEGSEETKWVLLVSINPGDPNGSSATQYLIGDFDGKTFTIDASFKNELKPKEAIWLDYGRDNYAGVTWSNIPNTDGRKLFIGWMSNWAYARQVPTESWRSSKTVPRSLHLLKKDTSYRLASMPVKELDAYIVNTLKKDSLNVDEFNAIGQDSDFNFSKLKMEIQLNDLKDGSYSISFHNDIGDTSSVGLNTIEQYFFIDRQKSGKTGFSEKFAAGI